VTGWAGPFSSGPQHREFSSDVSGLHEVKRFWGFLNDFFNAA